MKFAAGAVLMLAGALVQVTWASKLEIAGAFPNVVLIVVIALTWTQGVRAGLLWGCAGGFFLFEDGSGSGNAIAFFQAQQAHALC